MAHFYRVRVHTPDGAPVFSSKHFKLARTVDDLASLTGLPLSYQVIRRHLKTATVWAFGWTPAPVAGDDLLGCHEHPALVATITDLGTSGVEADVLPDLAAVQRDPALATLFKGSGKTYDENIDDLIAELDRAAARWPPGRKPRRAV